MAEIEKIATLIRDLLLILGIPTLIGICYKLFKQHIEILNAENKLLRETQYDRALTMIKAQKELFDMERKEFEQKINIERKEFASKIEELKIKADEAEILIQMFDRIMSISSSTINDFEKKYDEKFIQQLAIALNIKNTN